ncbi:type VII secretion protein EssA [Bacillus canaveralius]|uniref:Type VII secretion protein EssA n=1 Tax=Bacillus canaveralius TaxID=1403243 RepID=A0A2N5GMU6_9BACI|nr:type VII secretion protein EssA [Bacillus canaveralius]PLR83444.1 type VII secretion protein EssA [Bacillus canaveralius]PLR95375.1 type VII secretion protein EssA [Bacillus canaveralius]
MKLKGFIIAYMFPAAIFLNGISVGASPNIDDLMPNTYEKKEFNENTNFLHEDSLYDNKKAIPEEQKGLTFEGQKSNPLEGVKDQLFSGDAKANNTITAKAERLKLFSDVENKNKFDVSEDTESITNDNPKLIILYICLLAVGVIVMLGLLIPKMAQSKNGF